MKFTGIPVLFIPGNSGSFKQGNKDITYFNSVIKPK